VTVIEQFVNPGCIKTNSCALNLPDITFSNGNTLCPKPHQTRRNFFEWFKNDPQFNEVSIFLCAMPAAMCELYMPFNRSIVMLVSTPYHWGRQREDMLAEWNRNLLAIAKHPHNIIASNNKCVASCLHLLKRYATQPSPQHRSHGRTTCQSRGVMLRSGQARPRGVLCIY